MEPRSSRSLRGAGEKLGVSSWTVWGRGRVFCGQRLGTNRAPCFPQALSTDRGRLFRGSPQGRRKSKHRKEGEVESCPPKRQRLQLLQIMNKDSFEKLFRHYGMTEEYERQEAVFLWPQAVGRLEPFAQATYVKDGVLHVVACNPTVAQELTLLSDQILSKLNTLITGKPLYQIRIQSGDVPTRFRPSPRKVVEVRPEELQALFSDVDDPTLAAAFRSLYQKQRNREASWQASDGHVCPRCGITYRGRSTVCPGCRFDAIEESSLPN